MMTKSWKNFKNKKLSENEMLQLEGPISKTEIREQLFKHMKPANAPGQDFFHCEMDQALLGVLRRSM